LMSRVRCARCRRRRRYGRRCRDRVEVRVPPCQERNVPQRSFTDGAASVSSCSAPRARSDRPGAQGMR
jgi:hypothetical protein